MIALEQDKSFHKSCLHGCSSENAMVIFGVFQKVVQLQQMLSYLIDAHHIHPNFQLEQLILENLKVRENVLNNSTVDLDKYHQKVSQRLKEICQAIHSRFEYENNDR
ncbi:MAG: hypothetical protein ACLSBH_20655 [Coprobacillus cateniformis]